MSQVFATSEKIGFCKFTLHVGAKKTFPLTASAAWTGFMVKCPWCLSTYARKIPFWILSSDPSLFYFAHGCAVAIICPALTKDRTASVPSPLRVLWAGSVLVLIVVLYDELEFSTASFCHIPLLRHLTSSNSRFCIDFGIFK